MKEPVDHIARAHLPWREASAVTECGYDATKVKTISRAEYFQRRKDMGQQRCALLTCMTCSNTVDRWATWEDDPRKALGREIEWEAGWSRDKRGTRLRDELTAIAALVDAHKDDFLASVDAIEKRREWLEQKAALEKSRAVKTPSRSL